MAQVSIAQIQALFTITAAGSAASAASLPVVIASDQAAVATKGALSHNTAVPAATNNVGVLPAVASTASPTYTNTYQALLSVDLAGNLRVAGVKTHNAAVPGATNIGVLPALVESSNPTLTTTYQAALSLGTDACLRSRGIKTNNLAAPLSDNLGVLPAVCTSVAPTYANTYQAALSVDTAGNLRVAGVKTHNAAVPGATNIGVLTGVANAAIQTMTESYQTLMSMDLAGNQRVTTLVTDRGGATYLKVHSAASNNAAVVKASAGQVYGWYFFNNSTATKFVKLYNKTTTPAPATDNGVLAITIPVPAGGGTNVFWGSGVAFATGIGIAIVNLVSETDNTSVAAADVCGWLLYK